MRRREILFLFVFAAAQLVAAPFARARADDDDKGDDDDSDDGDDDSDDDSSDDDGGGDDDDGDDDRDDHDRAYEAVTSGKAVPLKQVLASFAKDFGGTVVDVKLVLGNMLRYRIRFIDAAGRVRHVYYDATTGKVLR